MDKTRYGNCTAGEKEANEEQESDLQNLVDDHIAATAAASFSTSTSNPSPTGSTSNPGKASGAAESTA